MVMFLFDYIDRKFIAFNTLDDEVWFALTLVVIL